MNVPSLLGIIVNIKYTAITYYAIIQINEYLKNFS